MDQQHCSRQDALSVVSTSRASSIVAISSVLARSRSVVLKKTGEVSPPKTVARVLFLMLSLMAWSSPCISILSTLVSCRGWKASSVLSSPAFLPLPMLPLLQMGPQLWVLLWLTICFAHATLDICWFTMPPLFYLLKETNDSSRAVPVGGEVEEPTPLPCVLGGGRHNSKRWALGKHAVRSRHCTHCTSCATFKVLDPLQNRFSNIFMFHSSQSKDWGVIFEKVTPNTTLYVGEVTKQFPPMQCSNHSCLINQSNQSWIAKGYDKMGTN